MALRLQNVAVFEFLIGQQLQKHAGTGDPRNQHAVRAVWRHLESSGIAADNVTRIYSEMEPCGTDDHDCAGFIQENFPDVPVTYSFKSPSNTREKFRSLRALGRAIAARARQQR